MGLIRLIGKNYAREGRWIVLGNDRMKWRHCMLGNPRSLRGTSGKFCRNPSCPNFGVAPRRLMPNAEVRKDRLGAYKLEGEVGKTDLVCLICSRRSKPLSNVALVAELYRLGTANGILVGESCRNDDCENRWRSVVDYPHEYGGYPEAL